MKSKVLNAWCQVVPGPDASGPGTSRISVESTALPNPVEIGDALPSANGDLVCRIALGGVGLTMAPDEILVADGLIRKFRVWQNGQGEVLLDVFLEHPAEPTVTFIPGMPFRTDFDFPRESLSQVLSGRVIAIDPGHGGKDVGVRGPVNLLEKDVALDIAQELRTILEKCGATALMSREEDEDVDARAWSLAVSTLHPDVVIEIHASRDENPLGRSYHIFAKRGNEVALSIAKQVASALTERMGIVFPGIETAEFKAYPLRAALRVEPVCLSYFADEANFRAPLYRKRIGQAIFNGLCRYFSSCEKEGTARGA